MSDSTYSKTDLPEITLESLKRTVKEFQEKRGPFAGFSVVESRWVPEDKIVMMSPCHCDAFQRSQPLHLAQHIRILSVEPVVEGDGNEEA